MKVKRAAMPWNLLALAVLAAAGWSGAACIEYPNCENDDHCREKNEFCLNGKCAQCRLDTHCGRGQKCVAGACEKIPGYCDGASDCVGREKCRNNQCGPECFGASDCAGNEECRNGACQQRQDCVVNADCPNGQNCVNGVCAEGGAVSGSDCSALEPVYFDFDESGLRADARDTLRKHADCVKAQNRSLKVEGHCDERGTEEYNLSLGERRAKATKDYLIQLGAKGNQLPIVSYGEARPAKPGSGEGSWQLNRRCEFVWQ